MMMKLTAYGRGNDDHDDNVDETVAPETLVRRFAHIVWMKRRTI